jgi:hypothetical protein
MDLLVAMATKKSLPDIVKRMLATLNNVRWSMHVLDPSLCNNGRFSVADRLYTRVTLPALYSPNHVHG